MGRGPCARQEPLQTCAFAAEPPCSLERLLVPACDLDEHVTRDRDEPGRAARDHRDGTWRPRLQLLVAEEIATREIGFDTWPALIVGLRLKQTVGNEESLGRSVALAIDVLATR